MPDAVRVETRKSHPGAPRPVTPITILAARLHAFEQRLATVEGSDSALLAEVHAMTELAAGLDPYLVRCSTPPSLALLEIAERTAREDWNGPRGNGSLEQEMLSGAVEGQFLKMLVHLARAEDVLEIGLFTGYSALAMAEALPPGGRVVACEIDPLVAAFAQQSLDGAAAGRRVDIRVGPARSTLAALVDSGDTFDLIFIDADKVNYHAYLDAILDGRLLAPHGLVVVDNTLMQGQPWCSDSPTGNGTAIAAFNDQLAADPRVEQVLVPLRDGVTLIRAIAGG